MDVSAIDAFWRWFAREADGIARLQESRDTRSVAALIAPRVEAIHPKLGWEVGPGKQRRSFLTITPNADRKLRPLTEEIVRRAPGLPDWEFYAARQPRPAPPEINVSNPPVRVTTTGWRFSAEEDAVAGVIHLVVVDPALARLDEQARGYALFIYLDAVLGEDGVERWIGQLDVAPDGRDLGPLRPISELPGLVAGFASRRNR